MTSIWFLIQQAFLRSFSCEVGVLTCSAEIVFWNSRLSKVTPIFVGGVQYGFVSTRHWRIEAQGDGDWCDGWRFGKTSSYLRNWTFFRRRFQPQLNKNRESHKLSEVRFGTQLGDSCFILYSMFIFPFLICVGEAYYCIPKRLVTSRKVANSNLHDLLVGLLVDPS